MTGRGLKNGGGGAEARQTRSAVADAIGEGDAIGGDRRTAQATRPLSLFLSLSLSFSLSSSALQRQGQLSMASQEDSQRLSLSHKIRRRSLPTPTMSPTNFSDEISGYSPFPINSDQFSVELPEPDVQVITSGGLRIPAHRSILVSNQNCFSVAGTGKHHRSASETPELRKDYPDPGRSLRSRCRVRSISLYLQVSSLSLSPRCSEEELDKFGIHLLAVSHVFLVPQLKQRCTKALAERLTIDNVVDVLQLARLCDAPDLYLRCMKLASNDVRSVEKTEGWKFLQDHDPWLELQILQFIDETELRKKRRQRHVKEQSLYLQLSEAMECLEHICTEGCTNVGPYDMEPTKNKGPCSKFNTCQGLQLLIRHFATCKRRMNGGCSRCKRMWQLLRLHSSICDQPDLCRVPLCREFKLKAKQEKKRDDERWKLLVRKVVSAKAISSLSLPKRKREEEGREITDHHGIKNFQL
ncbi:hypothetical protein TEA_025880 [Camellia sinensis var. sinensis]|uniref:TAZ-type domain-containing protein n=1 Tax=Camellia sinensis var. sinensis TaxID=542762 RepID=A0A4V3WQ67_CAMSN|nr:hypothetical protein TEA_025880 [Camellia sinensis var. sinensis]